LRGADRFHLDLGTGQLSQTEIQHLHLPARRKKNIRRLDVTMDDSLGMRGIERVGELYRNVEQAVGWQRAGVKLLIEVLSLEQFHRDERLHVLALCFFDRVDRTNIRMIQRRCGARLQQKTIERVLIARQLRRQELQRNFASEVQVFRLVHHSHATAAQLTRDAIVRDGLIDSS